MISTLRNNKNLLRRKSYFQRNRSFFETRKTYHEVSKGKVSSKNLSKEELLEIRRQVIKRRRKEDVRAWLLVLTVVVLVLMAIAFLIQD